MSPDGVMIRVSRSLLLLVVGAGCVAACARPRSLRIGMALDPGARDGALLAAEDLNAAGGIGGRPVSLVVDPAPFDPSTEATLARAAWLADAGVSVVISDNSSQPSLVLGSVLNERGVVQVCANSTSPRIHDLGPWSYALAPDDLRNGGFLARRIHAELPGARVAILYLNSAYGEGLRRGLDSAFRALRDSVVWELPFTDTTALPDLLGLVRRSHAEVVALGSYWEGLTVVAGTLEKLPASARPRVFAGDAAVPVNPRPGTEGVRIVAFWVPDLPDTASQGFAARFLARFGHPARPVDAMNYDGVRLAATALAATDGSPGAVREYLESLGGQRAPLAGLSGPISFSDRRRVGAHVFLAEYRARLLHTLPGAP